MRLQLLREVFHADLAVNLVMVNFQELDDERMIQQLVAAHDATQESREPAFTPEQSLLVVGALLRSRREWWHEHLAVLLHQDAPQQVEVSFVPLDVPVELLLLLLRPRAHLKDDVLRLEDVVVCLVLHATLHDGALQAPAQLHDAALLLVAHVDGHVLVLIEREAMLFHAVDGQTQGCLLLPEEVVLGLLQPLLLLCCDVGVRNSGL